MSAELGDWLLRCNGGEGMSECAAARFTHCATMCWAGSERVGYSACRSDMTFMFQFFKKLHKEQLSVTDLHFSSHTTFRAYVEKLCSEENSGWTRVTIPVEVEGFRHLQARG